MMGCTFFFPGERDEGGALYVLTLSVEQGEDLGEATKEAQHVLEGRLQSLGSYLASVDASLPGTLRVYVPNQLLASLEEPGWLFKSVDLGVWEVAEEVAVPDSWEQTLFVSGHVVGVSTMEEMALALSETSPPLGDHLVAWRVPQQQGERLSLVPLRGKSIITNGHIASATVEYQPDTRNSFVYLGLTPDGAASFGKATTRLVSHQIAIVANGEVMMSPVVREPIMDGQIMISLGASTTFKEAQSLAAAMSSKPIPGKLTVQSVGQLNAAPELGVPNP